MANYEITSKSQIIDLSAVQEKGDALFKVGGDFRGYAQKLKNISEQIPKEVLSADKDSFDDDVESIAANVESCAESIEYIATQIMSWARSRYNSQWAEYNNYLESLKKEE